MSSTYDLFLLLTTAAEFILLLTAKVQNFLLYIYVKQSLKPTDFTKEWRVKANFRNLVPVSFGSTKIAIRC
jgi:hypothetical protein